MENSDVKASRRPALAGIRRDATGVPDAGGEADHFPDALQISNRDNRTNKVPGVYQDFTSSDPA